MPERDRGGRAAHPVTDSVRHSPPPRTRGPRPRGGPPRPGLPQRALYSATKGAVHSLTLAMAAGHVREGIRVNSVNPGTADTPWIGRLLSKAADPAAEWAALETRQPTGRLVTADEVASAVAYSASPLSGATTGTSLAVDGGMQGLRMRPAGR